MNSTWKKYLLYSAYILIGIGILYGLFQLILAGYSVSWTGFGERTLSNGDIVGEKTLWEWMELLIIPLVLALGAFFLNRSERAIERENADKRAEVEHQIADERRKEDRKLADERASLERELAKDQQREEALNTYLDRMSELLLEKGLRTSKNTEARNIARTQTLKVLRILDEARKGILVNFLYEADLIGVKDPVINLKDADLIKADLSNTNLKGVNLKGAILARANFQDTNLEGSNLEDVTAIKASFLRANLKGANLKGSNLEYANLHEANLEKLNLERAKLSNANLSGAQLYGSNLRGAQFINADLMATRLGGADLYAALLDWVNFRYADLSGALNVSAEDLSNVKSLEGATMPDGTIHE